MVNKLYPVIYQNMGKSEFNTLSKDITEDKKVAIIMFVTPSNFAYKSETKLDSKMNVITENDTVIAMTNLIKYGASLLVNAEDTYESIGDSMPVATKSDVINIDNFLLANADKEIWAVCDAGIARSGFICWYLDQVHEIKRDWKGLGDYDPYEYKSIHFHAITSPALTQLAKENLLKTEP